MSCPWKAEGSGEHVPGRPRQCLETPGGCALWARPPEECCEGRVPEPCSAPTRVRKAAGLPDSMPSNAGGVLLASPRRERGGHTAGQRGDSHVWECSLALRPAAVQPPFPAEAPPPCSHSFVLRSGWQLLSGHQDKKAERIRPGHLAMTDLCVLLGSLRFGVHEGSWRLVPAPEGRGLGARGQAARGQGPGQSPPTQKPQWRSPLRRAPPLPGLQNQAADARTLQPALLCQRMRAPARFLEGTAGVSGAWCLRSPGEGPAGGEGALCGFPSSRSLAHLCRLSAAWHVVRGQAPSPLGDTPAHERPGFPEPSCPPTGRPLSAWNFCLLSRLHQTQRQKECLPSLLSRGTSLTCAGLSAPSVAGARSAPHGVGFVSADGISHLGQNQSQWVGVPEVAFLIKEQCPRQCSHPHGDGCLPVGGGVQTGCSSLVTLASAY